MIGTGELIVILGLGLILFGGKKLPEFARNLGLGIREFKKACNGDNDEQTEEKKTSPSKRQPETIVVEVQPEDDHERS